MATQHATLNGDENTILTVLNASLQAGDVVTVIDGAGAWDLCSNTHGAQFDTLKVFLQKNYYTATSTSMAFSLIRRCIDGVTNEWEQEMIADILVQRESNDGKQLIIQIGQYYEGGGFTAGLSEVQWQLDGLDQRRVDAIYKSETTRHAP